ncbi:MAG: hypothetical protein LBL04_18310 [Bacteroidales bacterium]|jgi:hypothetical protein|nr:hypothetical protein [Bacteroidales bacterium]
MTQIAETIDMIPNDVLIRVIRHSNDFSWNFLAMKIILTRLNLKIAMHDSDQTVLPECCDELRNLLKKSTNIPNSRADLKQILSLTA